MQPPIIRLMAKVEFLPNGCWQWKGALFPNGYGHFRLYTHKNGYAHIVAYELFRGSIPKELEIDHLCRNRGCINPYHMELVTHQENILRGISVGHGAGAYQRAKTHCPQGHPYNEANTRITRKGYRDCRVCDRLKLKLRYAKKGY